MIIPGYQQGIERKWNEITDNRKKLVYLLKEKTIYESMSSCSDNDRNIKWFDCMIERTKIEYPIQTNIEQASNQSTLKSITINENFDEYFDMDLWDKRGISEIRRAYKKNESYIKYDRSNLNSLDIAAKGITAYYSFRHSVVPVSRIDTPVGSFKGYIIYYDHCMAILRKIEENKPIYEGEKRSDIELIQAHLIDEEENFKQYQLFYDELKYESDRGIVEKIKKAVLYYPHWVKETYINEKEKAPEIIVPPLKDTTELKQKTQNLLAVLSGRWINGEKIMNDTEYKDIIEGVFYLIDNGKVNAIKKPINQKAPMQFIRRLFWTIHMELYTITSTHKDYFIEFLHAYFECFSTTEKKTTKNNFKEYRNGDFDKDFIKVMESIKK